MEEHTWHDPGQNINSIMLSAQRDGSLTRKQQFFHGKSA
ncbi:hypothetical protein E2C01_021125 [Portunus trituberculatus]|uniref:Uncharacterized protein n=1 Tax=Portunus trituberculatus TaxID=210409 RepID=A0A5B7E3J2_PORTR|nr:hypothetical protein [Portunus trituberculatus]